MRPKVIPVLVIVVWLTLIAMFGGTKLALIAFLALVCLGPALIKTYPHKDTPS